MTTPRSQNINGEVNVRFSQILSEAPAAVSMKTTTAKKAQPLGFQRFAREMAASKRPSKHGAPIPAENKSFEGLQDATRKAHTVPKAGSPESALPSRGSQYVLPLGTRTHGNIYVPHQQWNGAHPTQHKNKMQPCHYPEGETECAREVLVKELQARAKQQAWVAARVHSPIQLVDYDAMIQSVFREDATSAPARRHVASSRGRTFLQDCENVDATSPNVPGAGGRLDVAEAFNDDKTIQASRRRVASSRGRGFFHFNQGVDVISSDFEEDSNSSADTVDSGSCI